ncbi:MAG TPA: FAD-dependent oxidoreductase, partial [Archangium sp.]
MNATEPLWAQAPRSQAWPRYAEQGRHFDVIIIGAGITGLTCAWLLERAGVSIAVFEAGVVGSGVTGRTSAHLTLELDTRYQTVIKTRGEEATREIAQGQRDAIDFIERTALEQQIDCDFERVPGYLYALDQ